MRNITISVLSLILISTSVFGQSEVVKKSKSGICHTSSSNYYNQIKHFTPYMTLDECLKSGGRLPKN
ncbi:hypothetical protein DPM18_08170 [Polynucleobacter paneuropaeus]|nr:hypothetical protein DPM18_08170 [Polynucleobacter paneuropaeus]